jgi:hypothetical protein
MFSSVAVAILYVSEPIEIGLDVEFQTRQSVTAYVKPE